MKKAMLIVSAVIVGLIAGYFLFGSQDVAAAESSASQELASQMAALQSQMSIMQSRLEEIADCACNSTCNTETITTTVVITTPTIITVPFTPTNRIAITPTVIITPTVSPSVVSIEPTPEIIVTPVADASIIPTIIVTPVVDVSVKPVKEDICISNPNACANNGKGWGSDHNHEDDNGSEGDESWAIDDNPDSAGFEKKNDVAHDESGVPGKATGENGTVQPGNKTDHQKSDGSTAGPAKNDKPKSQPKSKGKK